MNRLDCLAAAAVAIIAGISGAFAGDGANIPRPGSPPGFNNPASPPAFRLKGTVLASGYAAVRAPAATFTPVHRLEHIRCKTSCSIKADELVQFQPSANGIDYALCVAVDGTYLSCPYLGTTFEASYVAATNVAFSGALAPGDHTVQTFLYVTGDVTVEQFYLSYTAIGER